MQHQTVPQSTGTYRVSFDTHTGVAPLSFPAPADADVIARDVADAFTALGLPADKVNVDLAIGQVSVADDEDDTYEWGSITLLEPKPDYWLTLADDLRQVADRIATLAGTPKPANASRLAFYCGLFERDYEANRIVVDAIAATFDGTTKTKRTGSTNMYEVDAKVGGLEVWAYCYAPTPEDSEKAAMRAELARLRTQLAEGGAR